MKKINLFNEKTKLIFQLFLTFFKIGAFTFGGGYAMIPIIERETAVKHQWIKKEEILDIIAVSESTPGPIAVNTATFVGYKCAGVVGSFFSTLGVTLPSFIIIFIISIFFRHFAQYKAVKYAFYGIRAGILALILKALWSMFKQCPKSVPILSVSLLAFIFAFFTNISILFIILGCALLGIGIFFYTERREKKQ